MSSTSVAPAPDEAPPDPARPTGSSPHWPLTIVLLARALDGTRGSAWARVTAVFGTAGLATAAILQAVDGVALSTVSGPLGLLFLILAAVWSWRRAVARHP